mgnify:CR=1 FL=1
MPNPKRLSGRFRFVNTEADDTLQYSTPSFKRLSASQRRTLNEVTHKFWRHNQSANANRDLLEVLVDGDRRKLSTTTTERRIS